MNVCNKYPTMAVNDVIQLHNAGRNGDIILPLLTVEALLALTLNQLERYIGLCEQSGLAAFEKEYYRYWLHRWSAGVAFVCVCGWVGGWVCGLAGVGWGGIRVDG